MHQVTVNYSGMDFTVSGDWNASEGCFEVGWHIDTGPYRLDNVIAPDAEMDIVEAANAALQNGRGETGVSIPEGSAPAPSLDECSDNDLLTVAETAQILRVSERLVRRELDTANLSEVRVASRRLVRARDLRSYIQRAG
jgi:hypothetical protein